LIIVVTIIGVMAAAAAPALRALDETRQAAAADDLLQLLDTARSHAMASGVPSGVRIDTAGQTLLAIAFDPAALAVVPDRTALGELSSPVFIAHRYPGVQILSIRLGDGSGIAGDIWFDHDATPHSRGLAAARGGDFTMESVVLFTGGHRVRVMPHSGSVLRDVEGVP
jgi:Tfp pilus assembly protein FimT